MRIATALLFLALAAPALAAPDPECLKRKKTDPKLVCMDTVDASTKVPTAIQLVMPRNGDAKRDVATTGDHLEDATQRAH
jgi:hypothetical protein